MHTPRARRPYRQEATSSLSAAARAGAFRSQTTRLPRAPPQLETRSRCSASRKPAPRTPPPRKTKRAEGTLSAREIEATTHSTESQRCNPGRKTDVETRSRFQGQSAAKPGETRSSENE